MSTIRNAVTAATSRIDTAAQIVFASWRQYALYLIHGFMDPHKSVAKRRLGRFSRFLPDLQNLVLQYF